MLDDSPPAVNQQNREGIMLAAIIPAVTELAQGYLAIGWLLYSVTLTRAEALTGQKTILSKFCFLIVGTRKPKTPFRRKIISKPGNGTITLTFFLGRNFDSPDENAMAIKSAQA